LIDSINCAPQERNARPVKRENRSRWDIPNAVFGQEHVAGIIHDRVKGQTAKEAIGHYDEICFRRRAHGDDRSEKVEP